jgi:hypothetical protein
MADCFRCGQDDHLSRDCPRHTPKRAAPDAAIGLPPSPPRQEDKPVPVVRQAWETGDATMWAERIRFGMGWPAGRSDVRPRTLEQEMAVTFPSRVKAAQQALDSRRDRMVLGERFDFPG